MRKKKISYDEADRKVEAAVQRINDKYNISIWYSGTLDPLFYKHHGDRPGISLQVLKP